MRCSVRCLSNPVLHVLLVVLLIPLFSCQQASPPAPTEPENVAPEPAQATPVTAQVTAMDGVEIAYEVRGTGSPTLVLIHCWSCDRSYWEPQVDFFSRSHQVVTLDLPGHGESGGDRRDWTLAAYGDDVRSVVETLDLQRVVLIGHSMGGEVAMEAARRMPERVVAVIGVDTLHNAEQRFSPEELEGFLKPFEEDFPAATRNFVHSMFPESADPALVERIAVDMAAAPPEVALALMRDMFSHDQTEVFTQVEVPIFSIIAENSTQFLQVETNRKYAPQFDSVVMEGVGHFPQLEKPEEFNQLLASVLETLIPAPAP